MAGMRYLGLVGVVMMVLVAAVNAQWGQFFGGHQEPRQPRNVASDSAWYQQTYNNAHCTDYLCPSTLSCVAFPHHCPCAFPTQEDKFELGEGSKICVSMGGFKAGEAARKVELARKGLL